MSEQTLRNAFIIFMIVNSLILTILFASTWDRAACGWFASGIAWSWILGREHERMSEE